MNRVATLVLSAAIAAPAPAQTGEAPGRAPPYWVSIAAGEARMRAGPGRQFPATWLYRRRGLPVQVIQVAPGWRRVRDQDGAVGWMLVTLLSDARTAVVRDADAALHAAPSANARVLWRVERGVVGRISECDGGWCAFRTGARTGYTSVAGLWGVAPGEVVE